MSCTFIQAAANDASGSGTSLAVTVSATGAGHLIVVMVKHEVGGDTTITASDGTSSFTAGPKVTATGGDLVGAWLYLLSSNSGKTAITVTWAAARSFRRVRVMEYAGTGAFALDGTGRMVDWPGGSGTAPDSGAITTTGSDEIVFGGYGEANGTTPSAFLINGLAADQSTDGGGNLTALWSRAFAAPFTGSAALTANAPAVVGILALTIASVAAPPIVDRPRGSQRPFPFLPGGERARRL